MAKRKPTPEEIQKASALMEVLRQTMTDEEIRLWVHQQITLLWVKNRVPSGR